MHSQIQNWKIKTAKILHEIQIQIFSFIIKKFQNNNSAAGMWVCVCVSVCACELLRNAVNGEFLQKRLKPKIEANNIM